MIIIVSTPIRIVTSYALAFAAGAVLTRKWQVGRNLLRLNRDKVKLDH